MTARKKTSTDFNFEQSIEQLSQIIEKMERGDLALEQSLTQFEQGMNLIKQCQQALTKAEQKVQILTKQGTLKDHKTDD